MCAHSTASPLAQESNDELERMRHLKDAIVFWDAQKTGWWTKSLYLSPNHLTHLNSTYSNREKLTTLANIRLGIGELEKTKLNLNTNKNEAANRGLRLHCQRTSHFQETAQLEHMLQCTE